MKRKKKLQVCSNRKDRFYLPLLALTCSMLLLCVKIGVAQPLKEKWYPKVGEVFPDHVFTELINYPTKTAKVSDFRGKWLILDVWGRYCTSCLESFPKMNKLQRRFRDSVQLIMIGTIKSSEDQDVKETAIETKRIYSRLAKEYDLDFTVAYDSTFYMKNDMYELPGIYIIDPTGILKTKTYSVSDESLLKLMNGEPADFMYYLSVTERKKQTYKDNIPLLTMGRQSNGGIDTNFLFRSLLIEDKADAQMPTARLTSLFKGDKNFPKAGRLEVRGFLLESLFRLAYFGESAWDFLSPRYYGKRNSKAIYDYPGGEEQLKKWYSYSLTIPRDLQTTQNYMTTMQADLENYFGLVAKIETKKAPVYYLDIADTSLIKIVEPGRPDSSIAEQPTGPFNGFVFKNFSIHKILTLLNVKSPINLPIIDRTGIRGKIDLDFKANLKNLDSCIQGLLQAGYKISRGTQDLESLVISQSPNY